MRGTILTYSAQTGEGLISGDDGQRYTFTGSDVTDGFDRIRVSANVDFETDGQRAIAIVPLISANAGIGGGDKNKIVAALLAFFVGGLGIHKFYLGKNTAGVIMLICSVFGILLLFIPTAIIGLIAFIEAIIYLLKSDQDFDETYVKGDKAWF